MLLQGGTGLQASRHDQKLVMRSVIEYTKDWDYQVYEKFENRWFIDHLNSIRENKRVNAIKIGNGLPLDSAMVLWDKAESDTMQLFESNFLYASSIKFLKGTDHKKLNWKTTRPSTNKIFYSAPIFSVNKKAALIWIRTTSGRWCGSGLILVLENINEEWVVTERAVKMVF